MEKQDLVIGQIVSKVKVALKSSRDQSASHNYDHLERVYKRAIKIALAIKDPSIDTELLKVAALLHDIDEPYCDNKENHVSRSVAKAEKILREVNYPPNKIQKVLQIILEHSSENDRQPSTPEAKILFDADKLDGLGSIGIARTFTFGGQQGWTPSETIEWYKSKIEKALPMIQTDIGKRMVEKELRYVNSFLRRYVREVENCYKVKGKPCKPTQE